MTVMHVVAIICPYLGINCCLEFEALHRSPWELVGSKAASTENANSEPSNSITGRLGQIAGLNRPSVQPTPHRHGRYGGMDEGMIDHTAI